MDFGKSGLGQRFSRDELLFLCAAAGAQKIFGIDGNLDAASKNALEKRWDTARQGLVERRYAEEDGEILRIKPDLAGIVKIISVPGLYLAATAKAYGQETTKLFYISNRKAVRLKPDSDRPDSYYVSDVPDEKSLAMELTNLMEFPVMDYQDPGEPPLVKLSADSFNKYIEAVQNGDFSAQEKILSKTNVQYDKIRDLGKSLCAKDNVSTLIVIKPQSDPLEIVDFTIYAGDSRLWKLDLKAETAYISAVGNSAFYEHLRQIAYLFNCF